MKCISFKVEGTMALMMNNPQTVNPFNEFTKALKLLTAKKKKTDEDTLQIYRLQFLASLYMKDGKYIIPAMMFWKSICTAAREFKLGSKFEKSIIIPEDCLLDFEDKDCPPEMLFDNEDKRAKYVDVRDCVINGRSRVPVCRSIFPKWKTEFTVMFDESQIDEDKLLHMIDIAGSRYGVGTYKKLYGRFQATRI